MTTVWLIQPKYVPQEHHYWADVDRCLGFMAEDYLAASQQEKDDICARMIQFMQEWRAQKERPTIMILDELSLLKAIFPAWYSAMLVPQMLTEMSSGETDSRALWAITQSPLCGDVGISGGNKAPFDLLAIEAQTTGEHLASICKSYAGVKQPSGNDLYGLSQSLKKTIAYHSAIGDWRPMCAYARFSPVSGTEPGQTAEPLAQSGGSAFGQVREPAEPGAEPGNLPHSDGEPELEAALHVPRAVLALKAAGATQDQIILAIWDAKKGGSQQYAKAREEYLKIIVGVRHEK